MAKGAEDEGEETEGSALDTAIRLERLARLLRQAGHAEGLVPAQWEALRFLARASRHSRAPGVVARYLGTTKGTASETLRSLEEKGLVRRADAPADKRQTMMILTRQGTDLLDKDPLRSLTGVIESLGGKTRRRLDRGIAALLQAEMDRQAAARFGTCPGCKLFEPQAGGRVMLCRRDNLPLDEAETGLLCCAYEE